MNKTLSHNVLKLANLLVILQLCIQKGPGRDLSRCTSGNLISKQNQTARLPDSTLSGIQRNTNSYRRLQRALRPRISETSHTLDIAKDKSNRRCPRDGCVYPFLERMSYICVQKCYTYHFGVGFFALSVLTISGMRRPQRLRTGNAGVHALSNALEITHFFNLAYRLLTPKA